MDDPPSLHRYFYANANPVRYIDPTGHLSWDQVKKGWDDAKAKIAEPVTNLANQGRQLIGAIEGAVDRGKVSFGEMAAVQFVGRLAQEPERIATDIKDLLTPGRRHDGSTGGLVRQRQIAQLEAAEKLPIVDRIGATLDAWGLQPAVAAEEGFARPVAQIPGQLGSVQQHLEQAARSNDGVDRMVHLAAATRDGAQATTSALAIAAIFEGGATPRRTSGAPEMAPYRATRPGSVAAAEGPETISAVADDIFGPRAPRSPLGRDVTGSFPDPDPTTYRNGLRPDTPVVDHVRARALRGHPTDPDNLHVKAWSENSRKGWHEGNYLREKARLVKDGLTPVQAEWVLSDYLRWIETDIHATPVDPAKLNKLRSP